MTSIPIHVVYVPLQHNFFQNNWASYLSLNWTYCNFLLILPPGSQEIRVNLLIQWHVLTTNSIWNITNSLKKIPVLTPCTSHEWGIILTEKELNRWNLRSTVLLAEGQMLLLFMCMLQFWKFFAVNSEENEISCHW